MKYKIVKERKKEKKEIKNYNNFFLKDALDEKQSDTDCIKNESRKKIKKDDFLAKIYAEQMVLFMQNDLQCSKEIEKLYRRNLEKIYSLLSCTNILLENDLDNGASIPISFCCLRIISNYIESVKSTNCFINRLMLRYKIIYCNSEENLEFLNKTVHIVYKNDISQDIRDAIDVESNLQNILQDITAMRKEIDLNKKFIEFYINEQDVIERYLNVLNYLLDSSYELYCKRVYDLSDGLKYDLWSYFFKKAVDFLNQKDHDTALKFFIKTLRINPDLYYCYFEIANICSEKLYCEYAEMFYKNIVKICGDLWYVCYKRAENLCKMGEVIAAKALLEEAYMLIDSDHQIPREQYKFWKDSILNNMTYLSMEIKDRKIDGVVDDVGRYDTVGACLRLLNCLPSATFVENSENQEGIIGDL